MEHPGFWILFAALLISLQAYTPLLLCLGIAVVVQYLTEYEDPLPKNDFKVGIVGAGFSGLAMAIKCRKIGIDYEIYDSSQEVGGTWRDNVYPGCACDITSHLYAYSFEPNANWSSKFAKQPEIEEYLKGVAEKHNLNIQFGRTVTEVQWRPSKQKYDVKFSDGKSTEVNFVVSATGPLRELVFPEIPGMSDFTGHSFHSAQWDTNYDVTGKRVAVIGTGASAVQIVPTICNSVSELFVFQRTPPWVPARNEYQFPGWVKWLFANAPGVMYLHRLYMFFIHEIRFIGLLRTDTRLAWIWNGLFTKRVYRIVKDQELAKKLIPEYEVGCKRVTPSDEYLHSFNRSNVKLVTDPIVRITQNGVQTQNGEECKVDLIVYATGYSQLDSLLNAFQIKNAEGQTLVSLIEDVPQFYKGIVTVGFPNLFYLLGPNTNLGHHSIVWMAECQVNYIARLIRKMIKAKATSVEVKRSALERYYQFIRSYLANKSFETGGCRSWYKKGMDGTNFSLWPCLVSSYWWETLTVNMADYQVIVDDKTALKRGRSALDSEVASSNGVANGTHVANGMQ